MTAGRLHAKTLFQEAFRLAFPNEVGPAAQPPLIESRLLALGKARNAFALHRWFRITMFSC